MKPLLTAALLAATAFPAFAEDPAYFTAAGGLAMERDENGVLVVTINDGEGGPITFTAQDHTEFVEAFYRISRDCENKVVILTGAGDYMAQIDSSTFGNVGDSEAWSPVHDEGVRSLENLANIRVPMIAAIEGRAHIRSKYALMENVIVAGESATFSDLRYYAGGIVPGDGIFTTWSYRAGPGRTEAWLLNPEPISAQTAHDGGVVAEVVPDGTAVDRAREFAPPHGALPHPSGARLGPRGRRDVGRLPRLRPPRHDGRPCCRRTSCCCSPPEKVVGDRSRSRRGRFSRPSSASAAAPASAGSLPRASSGSATTSRAGTRGTTRRNCETWPSRSRRSPASVRAGAPTISIPMMRTEPSVAR